MIALIDCNSFFCSCERLFSPEWQSRPVIVLSNNDGCAVSRTDEAKALGIAMGEPFFKIKEICKRHKVGVFSSNYSLYSDMSRRVMQVIAESVPAMEIYSIDEGFASLEGLPKDKLYSFCMDLKKKILNHTGIPVSIGIAPTKALAKIANHFAKKHKDTTGCVFMMPEHPAVDKILAQMDVGEIWGVGRKSAKKLNLYGVNTVFDFKYSQEKSIRKIMGIMGLRILREINGQKYVDLELETPKKKQILSSRSFGSPIYKKEHLEESIATHLSLIGEKLRKQDLVAGCVYVFIRTSFFANTPQYSNTVGLNLLTGTASTNKLIAHGFDLLDQIYRPGFEYKKAGAYVSKLSDRRGVQSSFFDQCDSPEEERLMEVIDDLNSCYGRGTLKYAACGIEPFWTMASRMRTPAYTTRWSELLCVG